MKKLLKGKSSAKYISLAIVLIAGIIMHTLVSTGSLSRQMSSLLVPVCAYIVAAIGLNVNVGISGELNLGQAGFMSIGGFTAVVVATILGQSIENSLIVLPIAILAGAVMAGFIGWLISVPVLKLQGDYLAIVTLAFGQIIMSLINNLYVGFDSHGIHFAFVKNTIELAEGGKMIISGPMGTTAIKTISSFIGGIVLILVVLLIVYNFINSKSGRAVEACRDNRIAAETVGINVAGTKTMAFIMSSAIGGAAGALYMLNYSSVAATKFDFNTSILILVYVVLGGLGNMTGTIIATTVLVVLPEMLRFMANYRMLIYAVVLIVIMITTNNEKIKTLITKLKGKSSQKEVENNG